MSSDGAESARTIEFLAWFEVNKQRLLIAVVALAVVVSGIVLYRYFRDRREEAASGSLLRLQLSARGGTNSRPVSVAQYQRVAEDYRGTSAGARAMLLAAETLFHEGRYAEAKTAFETAQPLLHDDALAAAAAFGNAACLDAMGKTNEALTAYQDVAVRHANSGVALQAKLAVAALYEARGDAPLALRSYNEITNALTSGYRSEALVRREALLLLHPELVSTHATPSPIPVPAGAPAVPSLPLSVTLTNRGGTN